MGDVVGVLLGKVVGARVGVLVGRKVGVRVGCFVGFLVGETDSVGEGMGHASVRSEAPSLVSARRDALPLSSVRI